MSEIILVNTEDLTDTIEEEKSLWVNKVLVALGANKDRLQDDDIKEYLMSIRLEVWNNLSEGTVDIHRDGKLVGQWKAPKLIKRKEPNESYYEIHLNEWALPFQMQRRR